MSTMGGCAWKVGKESGEGKTKPRNQGGIAAMLNDNDVEQLGRQAKTAQQSRELCWIGDAWAKKKKNQLACPVGGERTREMGRGSARRPVGEIPRFPQVFY